LCTYRNSQNIIFIFLTFHATLFHYRCTYIQTIYLQLTTTIHTDELVQQCLQGESKAYAELYDRYCKAMFSTCYRIVNHFAEAEDVLQDSFMDAFNNLKTFSYESTFGGWLKTIVINKSINHLRKKRIDLVDIDKVVTENLIDENEVKEEEIIYKVEEVKKAIQQLPDGYRTVLSLYLLEGYDHEEIAEIMHVATSTTRTQYMRAKQRLLQILK
jgi:RNA polymerase sigma factor (sigma-70 family)